jgi:hypothetical protein
MLVGFAIMEKEECGCLVSPNLEDELASSVVLVFILHDFLWDQGADWWTGLRKDEEVLLFGG